MENDMVNNICFPDIPTPTKMIKVVKISYEGSAPLIIPFDNFNLRDTFGDDADTGDAYEIEIVTMDKNTVDNLPEFDGF